MFSSRPTDAPRRWPRLRPRPVRTLRGRLLAAILALFAVVATVIGVVSTLELRRFLTNQLDQQVTAVVERQHGFPPPPRGAKPVTINGRFGTGTSSDLPPGQPVKTVIAHITDADVTDATILVDTESAPGSRQSEPVALTVAQRTPLATVPVEKTLYTATLGSLGDYRLIATPMPDGTVEVIGLPLSGVQSTVWRLVWTEAMVAGIGLLLAAGAGMAIVRLSLRPLDRVAATASRVAELPLSKGDVDLAVRVPEADTDPRTEVGKVGAALNRMLGHVGQALAIRQASEMRVRQFVADASHELRTPLAAIRGYAELTRRGRDSVPPDIAHALGRVESESARMTTLVDDLLLLARLDSGRPLERDPVELSRLVVDTVNDAHAAGREHRWLLDLPDEAIAVPGDSARLHQVLANLLANARTHTPPGTVVSTRLTMVNQRAIISVTDDGPGIPTALLPDIFERFARGDSSRSREAGSTGLGLAIVAAVVEAHGGTVEVSSLPGQTAFVVTLPGAERA